MMLLLLLAIPAIGAVITAFVPQPLAKTWAFVVSLLTLAIGVGLIIQFDFQVGGMQFDYHGITVKSASGGATVVVIHDNMVTPGTSFSLGIDAISLWLIALTVLLMPLAILASFQSIQDRPREYYAWMLALLAAMLGVFVARDLLLFYVFFELTLVPMFFIIGIWGGPERRQAAGKFFLFTFTGSVFTLAAAIFIGMKYGTFDIAALVDAVRNGAHVNAELVPALTSTERFWVLLGLLAGFAVKVPLFPVHTWLPLAHTEAPTAGSVILAGVLLKLGTYGLLRIAVPIGLLNNTGVAFPGVLHLIGTVCVIGILYGALVAWVQQDIKKLVAYSSVSHLGFCILGLVSLTTWGIQGSVLYMINHGLSTGALFLVIGMIYDRYHTRDINSLSGLAKKMPILAFFFILFTMSSIGLPGLNGFVSEFLTTLGAFTSPHLGVRFGALAALGIILGAVYMLHMAAKVIWGPLKVPAIHDAPHQTEAGQGSGHPEIAATNGHNEPGDIGAREIGLLIPLALAVLFLGVMPAPLMKTMLGPIQEIQGPVADTDNEVPLAPATAAKLNAAALPVTSLPESNSASAPRTVLASK